LNSTTTSIFSVAGNNANGGNIIITNSTTTSILSSGASSHGNGGNITISSSTFSSVNSNANYGNPFTNGVAGNITISAVNLDLSNRTILAKGKITIVGPGGGTGGTNGNVTLNYTTLNHSNLTLSALADLTLNGPSSLPGDLGPFAGGVLILPSDVITDASQCNLSYANVYYLGANITGDCRIVSNGATLDGAGHYTINGNVNGNAVSGGNPGFNFSLKNITITGSISSQGIMSSGGTYQGGNITIINSTTTTISASGVCFISCSSGGVVTISNSTTTSVDVTGGSNYTYSQNGGQGGSIIVSTSTTGSLIANGGVATSIGGKGGTISVVNSFESITHSSVTANGGNILGCGGTYGDGGSVVLASSTYTGTVSANSGTAEPGFCTNTSSNTPGMYGSNSIVGSYNTPSINTAPSSQVLVTLPPPAPKEPIVSPYSAGIGQSSATSTPVVLVSTSTPVVPVVATTQPPRSFVAQATQVIQQVAQTATAVANSPASKTVQTVGIFGGMVASVAAFTDTGFATPLAASELLLIPARLWGLLLAGLGIRRRSRPWGTVYDSVTKQPIDPAYVTARDANGKVIAESITDIDGRYGFLLPDGTYYLSAEKTNYEFPSKKMSGKFGDELYSDLYFGAPVTVHGGDILDKNIPMDQKNFDWNEYSKKERNALSFHTRHEKPWAKLSNYMYIAGLVISAVATVLHPSNLNIIILVSYIIVLASMKYTLNKKKLGFVRAKDSNEPLSYAIVSVTSTDHQTVLRKSVCDVQGRYYCIVPKGQCYIDIEKKNADGSYAKVYGSNLISTNSGIINSDFQV
jgi:hypothetical protein